jgi:hypothetical protein
MGTYGYERHQVASECKCMQLGTGMCGYVWFFAVFSVVLGACYDTRD